MNSISVKDVASYILNELGEITTMKLQKLLYYCQAWSLVWDEQPLFYEEIEAWANGPIVKEIYNESNNKFKINHYDGNPSKLSDIQKETIDSVLNYYGNKHSQWLSDLIHIEDPWKQARNGLSHNERGNNIISHASMSEYYGSIQEKI